MWLLECDGPLLGDKPLWLRPGTQHLFGRTTAKAENGERLQHINHKSVSRQHLTFDISPVKAGDSTRLHSRSEIKVTDRSKIGTTINGQKFVQETKTLDGKEYAFRLGQWEHLLLLKWQPMVLSFGSTSKKNKDPLALHRAKLEQADVKLITEYVTNQTTHVVSKKRNTPPALQSLLQARWLITDGWVDELIKKVEKESVNAESLLEQDFETNSPSEEAFLVPAGAEPNPRSTEYVKPNSDRAEVFQNYTFVFLSQAQYDTLMPVITAGSGKALLKEIQPAEMSHTDIVEYVKELGGQKGRGQFKLSQQVGRGGVVLVRPNDRDEPTRAFIRSIDLALDQRSIEQNEFLDAILMIDASGLRKPLEEEPDSSAEPSSSARISHSRPQSQAAAQPQRAVTIEDSPPPSNQNQNQRAAPEAPAAEQQEERTMEPPRKRQRRVITQSRFKGFDDFDPSQFSKPAGSPGDGFLQDPEPSQAQIVQDMDVDEPSQSSRLRQNPRKRPIPDDEEEQEDIYAGILTGHAAMKRLRAEAAENGDDPEKLTESLSAAPARAAKQTRAIERFDVRAEVAARKKKEEEQREKDRAYLAERLTEEEISSLQNLAIVEEMLLPVRSRPSRPTNGAVRGELWDPAWNGRKNFKRFRPQGQRASNAPRLQRVIVTLEEEPRKGHGIGDEYWLTSSRKSKSKSQSQSQSQSQTVRGSAGSRASGAGGHSQQQQPSNTTHEEIEDDEKNDEIANFRRRILASREEDAEHIRQVLPDEIAGQARDQEIQAAANSSQRTVPKTQTQTQSKAAGKRPATQQGGREPVKKARQTTLAPPAREVISLEDDDDDDGLRFRRRKR